MENQTLQRTRLRRVSDLGVIIAQALAQVGGKGFGVGMRAGEGGEDFAAIGGWVVACAALEEFAGLLERVVDSQGFGSASLAMLDSVAGPTDEESEGN